jgi:Phosphotransferase system fructose-specific component IIB
MTKIVGVSACPTGVAHTYMAADIVILTTDVQIKGEELFKGKPVIKATCSEIIRGAAKLMNKFEAYMSK